MKTQNGFSTRALSVKLSALATFALGLAAAIPANAAPPAPKPPPAAAPAAAPAAPPPSGAAAAAPTSAAGTPPPPPAGAAPGTPPPADGAGPGAPPPPPADAAAPQDGSADAAPKKKKKSPPPQGPNGWGPDPAGQPPMGAPARPPWAEDPNLPVLPRRIEFEEGDIELPGYQLKSTPSRGLFVGGMVTLLVPYGLSAFAATLYLTNGGGNKASEFGPLLIPVAGPFITLGQDDDQSIEEGYYFFQLANGFTQTAGVAMIAAAILLPDRYLQRVEALAGKPEVFVGADSVSVRLHF